MERALKSVLFGANKPIILISANWDNSHQIVPIRVNKNPTLRSKIEHRILRNKIHDLTRKVLKWPIKDLFETIHSNPTTTTKFPIKNSHR